MQSLEESWQIFPQVKFQFHLTIHQMMHGRHRQKWLNSPLAPKSGAGV